MSENAVFDRLKTKKRTGSGSLFLREIEKGVSISQRKKSKKKGKERWSMLENAALAAAARMYFMGKRFPCSSL
ncbi:MAG: hypothetical protein ACLR4Z_18315 [Butyricicoccaceae bacterium]